MNKPTTLENKILSAASEQPFKETTELGEVMSNLDSDIKDSSTEMSSIDFNAALSQFEINNIMIIDEFQRLGILPAEIGITRQKKRLSRSLITATGGIGSEQKVRLVQGEREQRSGSGVFSKLGGLFRPHP